MAVAGHNDKIDARSVGNWLRNHAGRVIKLGQTSVTIENIDEKRSVAIWQLVERKEGDARRHGVE